MNYDFDMFSIFPDEVQREFRGMFNDLGLSAMTSQQTALWRDPQVVEALGRADQPVKDLFLNSGFGINHFHSGAPTGRYPARDEHARNSCIMRLAENIKNGPDLKDADWGGFDIGEFIKSVSEAEPIDEVEIATIVQAQHDEAQRRKRAKLALALGVGLMVLPVAAAAVSALT